jgi:hypothetical protein
MKDNKVYFKKRKVLSVKLRSTLIRQIGTWPRCDPSETSRSHDASEKADDDDAAGAADVWLEWMAAGNADVWLEWMAVASSLSWGPFYKMNPFRP